MDPIIFLHLRFFIFKLEMMSSWWNWANINDNSCKVPSTSLAPSRCSVDNDEDGDGGGGDDCYKVEDDAAKGKQGQVS